MAKKDFSNVNTENIYSSTIAEATAAEKHNKPRKTYTKEEAADYLQGMKTTGRKGVKLPRINLAFSPDCYEYIQTMSRVRGETLTQFVNTVLRQHMDEHRDVYDKALEFRNSL